MKTDFTRATVLKFFVLLAGVSFVLRIWYAGHLYQDDGLWFTAAEEILRGKALYREVYFDKPPMLAFVYAGLFKIFGAHIITIRLFTICYSVAASFVIYRFGAWLYDKRDGLIAAGMFAVFSTTYISGDMQSLNTDFLMVPYYTGGAFLFARALAASNLSGSADRSPTRLALAAGLMAGLAFNSNPKGGFDLIFFGMLLFVWRARLQGESSRLSVTEAAADAPLLKINSVGRAARLLCCSLAGFAIVSLPFLAYLLVTHSLEQYWRYVWDWGFRYARYYPALRAAEIFLRYGTDYFAINNTLLITLFVTTAATIVPVRRFARIDAEAEAHQAIHSNTCRALRSDLTLLLWFAVSFFGLAAGGRFFAHYYYQILPSLSLIGARGLGMILSWTGARNRRLQLAAIAILFAGFSYTLVRSHTDTAGLAIDWIRGRRPNTINHLMRTLAAEVKDIAEPAAAADIIDAEGIREAGPRTRSPGGSPDYLFIWGNLPEVYYWSALLPASRYLSTQPLIGVPADVVLGDSEPRSILRDDLMSGARAELALDLEATKPRYILDELGIRDSRLSIESFAELKGVMAKYERHAVLSDVVIYMRRTTD